MAINLLAGKNLLAPQQDGDPWDQDMGDPWDEDLPKKPVNLLAQLPQPSFGEQTKVALKQGYNVAGDLINRAATGVAGGIADLLGQDEARDKMFQAMEKDLEESRQWANPNKIQPGVLPSIIGAIPNLPAQMATFPLAPFETGQEMIQRGESLSDALKGTAITTGMNALGIALPAAVPGGIALRTASGAGINAMQTVAQQLSLQGVSKTKEGKEAYKLKPQDIAIAGIMGAGFGAVARPPKPKAPPVVDPTLDTKVDEFFKDKTSTEGRLGGELPGEVNMDLFRQVQEQDALRKQQEYADALEAQRVMEAEVYAAQQFPEQPTTGLSTGEGVAGGKVINRAPVTDSGLMGLPAGETPRPVGLSTGEGLPANRDPSRPQAPSNLMGLPEGPRTPPVGLSVGENTPGGAIINRPAGPSNLMGELVPPVAAPIGLSTGEGVPGGRNIQRTPETPSGVMGVEPKPFDPFGSAGASPKRINKFGQGGQAPIIGDLAEGIVRLGGLLKGKKTGQVVLPPDSLAEPRSPEMVKTKLEKTAKAKAIGLKGTVYDSPGSLEELRANPGKDIGFSKVGVGGLAYEFESPKSPGQLLGSGAEAVVRRNPENNSTKYVRGLYSKARNLSENLVHKYVNGPGAITKALRQLDPKEQITAYQVAQRLSKLQEDYSPALADHLGLSTNVRTFLEAYYRGNKGLFDFSASVNAKLGIKQYEERKGYSSTDFDVPYRTLVYEVVKNKDGTESHKIIAPVNANTLWEHNKGVEHYKEKSAQRVKEGLTPYKFTKLDPVGLKTSASAKRQFDPMATLLTRMAALDPRFAEAKAEVDSIIAEKSKKLFSFDVHELHKKGVEGGIGNKPWLTLERNARDFFKNAVDHLDTGFRYWAYLDAITKTRQFITDPTIEHPNAKRWAEKYTQQITGQSLNPVGGMLNFAIDALQTPFGVRGAKTASMTLGVARGIGNAWLMGVWNPIFMGIQTSQLVVNGLVEAARLRVDLNISPYKMAKALPEAITAWSYLTWMDKTGKLDKATMFGDFTGDFKWAQEHGLSTYSEVALSHEAAMDPKLRLAKDIIMHPTILPEYVTRPTAFLWFAQMFRDAGYTGDEARLRAREATDYNMTNYHGDELPMIYKDLGVAGKNIGSLRAFVHNNTDQFIARTLEANKYPAAFATMMGMTLLLQGITGVVGYSVANEISMALTDKTLTEWMEDLLEPENRKYLHGFASAMYDVDIQSRFSTADVLPGSFAEGIVGPQISKFGKVIVAGYEYGKNQDQNSLLKLGKELTPSGMAGIYEDKLLTDKQGFVLKDGERKYDKPRSQGERDFRRQYNTRPLRERLEDEALYRDTQRMAKMNEKQRSAFDRMKTAHILGDTAGFAAARKKYIEEGGSLTALEAMLERAKADAKKSERERRQGELTDSLSSIQRFKNYQEKP